MADYSNFQKKVISRYYDNRDQIDEQRLSELVTNIYLGKKGKKMENDWNSAAEVMRRLGVPDGRIKHVYTQRDPALLAEVVQDITSGKIVKKKKTPPPKNKDDE